MSANLHVDVGATSLFVNSLSVAANMLSGGVVGQWVDLSNSDTFCNVYVAAGAGSGPVGIAIQTAYGPNVVAPFVNAFSGNIFSGGAPQSGSFTDPTSGLAQLPTWVSSGGVLWVNSGLYGAPGTVSQSGQVVNGAPYSTLPFGPNPIQGGQGGAGFVASGTAPEYCSGGIAFAAFQRPGQYARLIYLSGASNLQYLQAGFLSQLMTTGSGGGQTQQPLGGFVNV